MLLLPADKKKVVQEHFAKKAKCALALNSSKTDSNDKTIAQKDLKEDEVSTYYWTTTACFLCNNTRIEIRLNERFVIYS